jgi:glycerophosphoryl diester phosphodiesterase
LTAIFAHRGSGPLGPEPENTTAAFLAARALGADGVEFDVRRTGDRHLVVHHDAALREGGLICEMRASELPSEVPSLGEALAACDGLLVNIEIKNASFDPDFDPSQWVARATAETVLPGDGSGRRGEGVIVSSFSRRSLAAFSELATGAETAWLVGGDRRVDEAIAAVSEVGARGLHPHDSAVDRAYVSRCHAAGFAVRVWTVDDPARIADLVELGVEAVVTNEVVAALDGRRRAELAKHDGGREQSGA